MTSAGVSLRHADRHRATHQRFVAQVVDWIHRRKAGEHIHLDSLIAFLADWLVFHILGDDQSLGRQVQAVQSGVSPDEAYAHDQASDDPRTGILLGALRRLYAGLTARNEELVAAQASLTELNASLEQRVDARTTELREANERLQTEQARALEAEKMASLGRMVAGFAHEVNTPVGIAVGAVSQGCEVIREVSALLSQEEVTEEDLRTRLDTLKDVSELALNNLQRTADLVHRFKRTAVDQTSEQMRTYELAEVVEDVMKSLRNEFKHTPIRFEVDCAGCQPLYGPAGTVAQLLVNLMQNSRLHGFAGGTAAGCIRIRARTVADSVTLQFADDGAGMAADTVAHVFEPFFTTARAKGGSGLGLYIAHSLVTQGLQGTIACHSVPGEGTRFDIGFPRRLVNTSPEQT
jgi:signal transduction histidine kinase